MVACIARSGCLRGCPADGAIAQYTNGIVDFHQDNCIGCQPEDRKLPRSNELYVQRSCAARFSPLVPKCRHPVGHAFMQAGPSPAPTRSEHKVQSLRCCAAKVMVLKEP